MIVLKIIAAWFALSIPCTLLIARMFAKHIEQLDDPAVEQTLMFHLEHD